VPIELGRVLLNLFNNAFFATKPAGEGTGLSLSLSYDLITPRRHAHSGQGSIFLP
jgi:C4-dicarboxylate-specific signal transduction histidine kinase